MHLMSIISRIGRIQRPDCKLCPIVIRATSTLSSSPDPSALSLLRFQDTFRRFSSHVRGSSSLCTGHRSDTSDGQARHLLRVLTSAAVPRGAFWAHQPVYVNITWPPPRSKAMTSQLNLSPIGSFCYRDFATTQTHRNTRAQLPCNQPQIIGCQLLTSRTERDAWCTKYCKMSRMQKTQGQGTLSPYLPLFRQPLISSSVTFAGQHAPRANV